MKEETIKKRNANVWLGVGLTMGFVAGFKLWQQHKARQNSPLIREDEEFWAMVTDASNNIGNAYARRLAQLGYSLILISQSSDLLEKMSEEIVQKYQVKVRFLTVDLSTLEGVEQVESLLSTQENLNLLVNNTGTSTIVLLAGNDRSVRDEMIQKHVVNSVRLTRAALPGMLNQKRGAIVNVSSINTSFPLPGEVTNNVPKSYLNAFTQALRRELAGNGVRVQALYPGFAYSELQATSGKELSEAPDQAWENPDRVVDRSLRDLAHDRVISVPGIAYRVLKLGAPYIPRRWFKAVKQMFTGMHMQNSQFSGFRKRTWNSFNEFVKDFAVLVRKRQQLRSIKDLDRAFLRRLMLMVTHVNGCRYCASYHSKAALMDGIPSDEVEDLLQGIVEKVPEDELSALLYAQYWAEEGGYSDPQVRLNMVDRYGEEKTCAIENSLQIIKFGNYAGNTLDYLLYMISGGRWGNTVK